LRNADLKKGKNSKNGWGNKNQGICSRNNQMADILQCRKYPSTPSRPKNFQKWNFLPILKWSTHKLKKASLKDLRTIRSKPTRKATIRKNIP
jgi:hypothetical protein